MGNGATENREIEKVGMISPIAMPSGSHLLFPLFPIFPKFFFTFFRVPCQTPHALTLPRARSSRRDLLSPFGRLDTCFKESFAQRTWMTFWRHWVTKSTH